MKTIPYIMIVLAGLAAFAFKLRDLRRDPKNPTLRSLCLTFALVGLAFTTAVPAVERTLERATGLYLVWGMLFIAMACISLQITVLLWSHPLERARPKICRRLLVNGVAVVLICLPAFLTEAPPALRAAESAVEHDRLAHGLPLMAEGMLVYLAVMTFTMVDLAVQTRRQRRVVNRHWLNRSLALVTVAAVADLGYTVTRAVHVVALRYFDTFLEPVYQAGPAFAVVAVTGALAAWTMPVWGPRLDRVRAYRQLRPLWEAMVQVTPEVVFTGPVIGRTHWWRTRDLDFRLYRRIIEIRDSHLTLRPYMDESIADTVRRRCMEEGLDGDRLNAAVEAGTLAAAIRAKAQRRPAPNPPTHVPAGGTDIAEELIWLSQVARMFKSSPTVASAAIDSRAG